MKVKSTNDMTAREKAAYYAGEAEATILRANEYVTSPFAADQETVRYTRASGLGMLALFYQREADREEGR